MVHHTLVCLDSRGKQSPHFLQKIYQDMLNVECTYFTKIGDFSAKKNTPEMSQTPKPTWPPKKVEVVWGRYNLTRFVCLIFKVCPICIRLRWETLARTRIFLNPPASPFNRSQFGSLCSHENGFGLACTGIHLCLDLCNCIFLPQISADIDANPSKLGDMIQCDNRCS